MQEYPTDEEQVKDFLTWDLDSSRMEIRVESCQSKQSRNIIAWCLIDAPSFHTPLPHMQT